MATKKRNVIKTYFIGFYRPNYSKVYASEVAVFFKDSLRFV